MDKQIPDAHGRPSRWASAARVAFPGYHTVLRRRSVVKVDGALGTRTAVLELPTEVNENA